MRCRERIKLPPTPRNLSYAAKLKATIELEIGKGLFDYRKHFPDSSRARLFSTVPGDQRLIRDYLETWLAAEKQNIRPSTLYGYEKILKHSLNPAFGDILLSELKRKHVWDWVAAHPNMSAKRTRNVLSVLRIALNAAVEQGVNHIEPTSRIQSPQAHEHR